MQSNVSYRFNGCTLNHHLKQYSRVFWWHRPLSSFCIFVFSQILHFVFLIFSLRATMLSMSLAWLLCILYFLYLAFLHFCICCISIISQSNRAGYVAGPAEAQCPSLSTGSLCLWWVRNFCPPPDNIEALFSLTFSSTDDILHMLVREAPVQMGIARIAIRSPPHSHLGLLRVAWLGTMIGASFGITWDVTI